MEVATGSVRIIRANLQLPLFEQKGLVAEIVRADVVEPSAGMTAEGVDDPEITLASRGGVVAADELVMQTL